METACPVCGSRCEEENGQRVQNYEVRAKFMKEQMEVAINALERLWKMRVPVPFENLTEFLDARHAVTQAYESFLLAVSVAN